MRKLLIGALLVVSLAVPLQAAMTLAEFLPRANRLQAKGPMAIFSGDLKPVMNEMRTVGRELKAEGERRKAAGLPRRSCPPEGTKLDSKQILAMLNAIPPADRGISVKDGLLRVMAARYPCL